MRALIFTLIFVGTFANAKTVEDISFADSLTQSGKTLVLNGAGLRTKRKLGINWRVYVAGLYLSAKSSDANAIIASTEPAVLDMVFLRGLDKDTLQEAWSEGFTKNCKFECDKAKAQLAEFNALMKDVKKGQHLKIVFEKDGVSVDGGAKISGEVFRKDLMAIFLGTEPPTPEFKKALLGG